MVAKKPTLFVGTYFRRIPNVIPQLIVVTMDIGVFYLMGICVLLESVLNSHTLPEIALQMRY